MSSDDRRVTLNERARPLQQLSVGTPDSVFMCNEFVPGETGFVLVWVSSAVEIMRKRTCIMEAKQRKPMLTAVRQGGSAKWFQLRLWTQSYRRRGDVTLTQSFAGS